MTIVNRQKLPPPQSHISDLPLTASYTLGYDKSCPINMSFGLFNTSNFQPLLRENVGSKY